jgi:hypothetical protein
MIDSKDVVTAEEWKKLIEKTSSLLPEDPDEPWQYIYVMRKVPKHVIDNLQKQRNEELAIAKWADVRKLLEDINGLGYRIGFDDAIGSLSEKRSFRVIPYWELKIE